MLAYFIPLVQLPRFHFVTIRQNLAVVDYSGLVQEHKWQWSVKYQKPIEIRAIDIPEDAVIDVIPATRYQPGET